MACTNPNRAVHRGGGSSLRSCLTLLALTLLACNQLAHATATPRPTAAVAPLTSTVAPTATPVAAPTTAAPDVDVLAPDNLSAGDPYAPDLGNRGYDVQHYTLRAALRPGVTALEAIARLELESTQADLRQVSLDFIGFDIDAVAVDGTSAAFDRLETKLLITLTEPLAMGAPATLEVAYHGLPVQEPSPYVPFIAHLGLQFHPDHIYVVSEPDGARYWFPANDHPRDKATFRFELVVPPGQTGVANGNIITTETDVEPAFADGQPGDLYVWEHDFPMAPYHATVAVGPFVRVDDISPAGVPLRSYMFAQDQPRFEPYRAPVGQMVDWLAEQLGPYPFEAFGYVLVEGLGGALETQTMVIMGRDSLSEGILVHELAHHWFGDWVSLDSWGEMWRSEGFATYFAALWPRRHHPAELAAELAPRLDLGPQSPFPLGSPPPGQLFGGPIYDEGALFVADLRRAMGDDAFYTGLRAYFERYAGATASDRDFQSVMESAAGQSLDAIFDKWLE